MRKVFKEWVGAKEGESEGQTQTNDRGGGREAKSDDRQAGTHPDYPPDCLTMDAPLRPRVLIKRIPRTTQLR